MSAALRDLEADREKAKANKAKFEAFAFAMNLDINLKVALTESYDAHLHAIDRALSAEKKLAEAEDKHDRLIEDIRTMADDLNRRAEQ